MNAQAALDHLAAAPAGEGAVHAGAETVGIRFRGSRKWHAVYLEIDGADLYRMTFVNARTARVETVEGVYADQLADTFRRHTGLDTHL